MMKNILSIIGLLILGAVVLLLWELSGGAGVSVDTENWETYTNSEFNFTLHHPSDWEVAEFPDHPAAPIFNIYKPEGKNPPFTHHSDVVQVSVYPHGFPTEGVFGERATSTVSFNNETTQSHDFILKNGDAWGTLANFKNYPESWQSYGFIWASATIHNKETICLRDGEEITDENACDPLFGDTIVRTGEVDEKERAIEEEILESFTFTKEDAPAQGKEHDLIVLDSPEEGEVIESPLTIRGEARGQWYFEATFPLVLTNWDGEIIAEGHATAQDEWMSEEFVPFEGTLTFEEPEDMGDFSDWGNLILQKSNASGLSEHDDAYEIRVRFRE